MIKKLFFTTRYDQQKEANTLNTCVSLVYDTKEGKLQLVDSFGGEVKTFDITLTEVAAEGEGEGQGEGQGEGSGEGGQGGEGGNG